MCHYIPRFIADIFLCCFVLQIKVVAPCQGADGDGSAGANHWYFTNCTAMLENEGHTGATSWFHYSFSPFQLKYLPSDFFTNVLGELRSSNFASLFVLSETNSIGGQATPILTISACLGDEAGMTPIGVKSNISRLESYDRFHDLASFYTDLRFGGHSKSYATLAVIEKEGSEVTAPGGLPEDLKQLKHFYHIPSSWMLDTNKSLVFEDKLIVVDGPLAWCYQRNGIGAELRDAKEYDPKMGPLFAAARIQAARELEKRGVRGLGLHHALTTRSSAY